MREATNKNMPSTDKVGGFGLEGRDVAADFNVSSSSNSLGSSDIDDAGMPPCRPTLSGFCDPEADDPHI